MLHGAVPSFISSADYSQRLRFLDSLKSDTINVIVNAWEMAAGSSSWLGFELHQQMQNLRVDLGGQTDSQQLNIK